MAHNVLQEATDPSTDPERLRQLANIMGDEAVQRGALKNPSLPEDAWRAILLWGYPEPWANPMAPIYLLTWTPRQGEAISLEGAAQLGTHALWMEPERYSPEGKALLAAKVQEGWATSEEADDMMVFLGWWARIKGEGSVEHREVVRLLVLCVRTASNLTDGDHQALDLLEAWSAGGEDRRYEAEDLADSEVVKDTSKFAHNPRHPSRDTIQKVLIADDDIIAKQAMLADLIRRNKPIPPVAW